MQANINEYNSSLFGESFTRGKIYSQLLKDFNYVTFKFESIRQSTPRQSHGESMFSAIPFYYLEFLTKHNPKEIYDLGCGWNIFKKYIPNIIGVGAETNVDNFYGDIHDFVDLDYVENHHEYFESVFSINALHFRPLSELRDIVLKFSSMIKPNGRGFLAINVQRMIEQDKLVLSNTELECYIRTQLDNVDFTYEVFDVDLTVLDEYMDGNIRMVIYKEDNA
jgi:hypothetical protein